MSILFNWLKDKVLSKKPEDAELQAREPQEPQKSLSQEIQKIMTRPRH